MFILPDEWFHTLLNVSLGANFAFRRVFRTTWRTCECPVWISPFVYNKMSVKLLTSATITPTWRCRFPSAAVNGLTPDIKTRNPSTRKRNGRTWRWISANRTLLLLFRLQHQSHPLFSWKEKYIASGNSFDLTTPGLAIPPFRFKRPHSL